MKRLAQKEAERRPLRWAKFAGGLAAAALTLSIAAPGIRLFAEVVAGPFTEAPPLQALLPSLTSALAAVLGLGFLVIDVSLDRKTPRWTLALLVANLSLLTWSQSSSVLAPPGADAAIAAALAEVKAQLAGGAGGAASDAEGLRSLEERVGTLPATSIRDRLFRPVAPRLLVLEDRDGPLLSLPAGVAPATVLLAVNRTGTAAWLTATTLEGREVALLRDGGLPVILGIPLCPSNAPSGGMPC